MNFGTIKNFIRTLVTAWLPRINCRVIEMTEYILDVVEIWLGIFLAIFVFLWIIWAKTKIYMRYFARYIFHHYPSRKEMKVYLSLQGWDNEDGAWFLVTDGNLSFFEGKFSLERAYDWETKSLTR